MEQHERRHLGTDSDGSSASPQMMKPLQPAVPSSQMILIPVGGEPIDSKNVVKAAGTFYPQNMIGQPQAINASQPIQIIQTTAGPIAVTIPSIQTAPSGEIIQASLNPEHQVINPGQHALVSSTPSPMAGIIPGQVVSTTHQPLVSTSNSMISGTPVAATGAGLLPLTMLLQQKVQMPKPDWLMQLSKMHFSMLQNCGRPFCKLKKRNHYHCSECNQAFTDELKIRAHINNKHRCSTAGGEDGESGAPPAKLMKLEDDGEQMTEPANEMEASGSLHIVEDESHDSSMLNGDSLNLSNMSMDSFESGSSLTPTKSGRKRKRSWKFIETDPSQPRRTKSPRGERNDINVPAGYLRIRFDENCGEEKCSYRQLQTHYHCEREDCKYGFSDRSRMLPHTLRHERIDKIMGTDFRQFRGNLDCERDGCEFRKKSSHFHCLKCEFMCCDTNRVIGHRKHHSKMDGYRAQGFTKTTGTQDCGVENCAHKNKQTHYHCLQGDCNYAVLTPSQMSPHKFKHDLEAKRAQIHSQAQAQMAPVVGVS